MHCELVIEGDQFGELAAAVDDELSDDVIWVVGLVVRAKAWMLDVQTRRGHAQGDLQSGQDRHLRGDAQVQSGREVLVCCGEGFQRGQPRFA